MWRGIKSVETHMIRTNLGLFLLITYANDTVNQIWIRSLSKREKNKYTSVRYDFSSIQNDYSWERLDPTDDLRLYTVNHTKNQIRIRSLSKSESKTIQDSFNRAQYIVGNNPLYYYVGLNLKL